MQAIPRSQQIGQTDAHQIENQKTGIGENPAPQVAIVLACFRPNREFFSQQIESIKSQTFKAWTCWVVDDASDEASLSAISEIINSDSRFILVKNSDNLGVVNNFSRACGSVPADYDLVALCDQDDVWNPDKLEKVIPSFTSNNVMMVHSDLRLTDALGRVTAASLWSIDARDLGSLSVNDLIFENIVTGCSCIFRRQLLELALPIPGSRMPLDYYHDQWFALCALARGEIVCVREPLVDYRQHGKNLVGAARGSNWSFLKKVFRFQELLGKLKKSFLMRQRLALDLIGRVPEKREIEIWLPRSSSIRDLGVFLFHRFIRRPRDFRLCLQIYLGALLSQLHKF